MPDDLRIPENRCRVKVWSRRRDGKLPAWRWDAGRRWALQPLGRGPRRSGGSGGLGPCPDGPSGTDPLASLRTGALGSGPSKGQVQSPAGWHPCRGGGWRACGAAPGRSWWSCAGLEARARACMQDRVRSPAAPEPYPGEGLAGMWPGRWRRFRVAVSPVRSDWTSPETGPVLMPNRPSLPSGPRFRCRCSRSRPRLRRPTHD